MKKYGTVVVLPEEGDDKKTAAKNFSEKDREALIEESSEEDE